MKKQYSVRSRVVFFVVLAIFIAHAGDGDRFVSAMQESPNTTPSRESENISNRPGVNGVLSVDITDILGNFLESRVRLTHIDHNETLSLRVPTGQDDFNVGIGKYLAYISVYDEGVPYVVSSQRIEISRNKTSYLLYELLEGAGAGRPLGAFDQDGDQFLGRVEIAENTDPSDANSVPGIATLNWPAQHHSSEAGWLRGELHAHSKYGVGTEKVSRVIRRAEKLGLDFLAILDRNTLEAPLDPEFRSDTVVLIPAMEWGSDDKGVALVYSPRSLPMLPETSAEMGAMIRTIRRQGGLVYAAHPCYPIGSWNWNVDDLNGIQAWCMGWRSVPGITVNAVNEYNRILVDDRFVHPLAKAANLPGLSSNGQSTMYWDYELNRGLRLGVIGGSQTGSRKVRMAEPVTYVYAMEKSLQGILDGIRLGRTYISRGLDGPQIDWVGDISDDDTIDVSIGGVVPLDVETKFYCRIRGAKGKKLEIMLNGSPDASKMIPKDDWIFEYVRRPEDPVIYRIRIVTPPTEKGFGLLETVAMTGPIYVRGVMSDTLIDGELLKIENDYIDPEDLNSFMQYLENNGVGAKRVGE